MTSPYFFCDWITCRIVLPHSDGCFGGRILMVDAAGEISWSKQTWGSFEDTGSFSSKVACRSISEQDIMDTYSCGVAHDVARERAIMRYGRDMLSTSENPYCMLEISGNPTKFLQGHNVWGCDDIRSVIPHFIKRVLSYTGLELDQTATARIDSLDFYVSRFDLTTNLDFKSVGTKQIFLASLRKQSQGKWAGRGVAKETAMFGSVGRFQQKFYDKFEELKQHWPKMPDFNAFCNRDLALDNVGSEMASLRYQKKIEHYSELTNFLTSNLSSMLGLCRFETTIGSKWLSGKRISKLGHLLDYVFADSVQFLNDGLDKLKLGVANMDDQQSLDLRETLRRAVAAGHVPASTLGAYELWISGRIVKDCFKRPTYYRLRKHILSVLPEVDISLPFVPVDTDKKTSQLRGMLVDALRQPADVFKTGIFDPKHPERFTLEVEPRSLFGCAQ